MNLALFAPGLGYYTRPVTRVGYGGDTDFYTATTSGPVFGELVAAAAKKLLRDLPPEAVTFVEIGAEPGKSVLDNLDHGFAKTRCLRLGTPIELQGPCVVFSNELFDAQPCRRLVFTSGQWHERLVKIDGESLSDVIGPVVNDLWLPASADEGYSLDAPQAAASLAATIADQPWHGLFMACDYGKSWPELAGHTPGGTVRAYHRHRQSNDLLANPGEQDLTCHVCWDWIQQVLRERGFAETSLQSQESFFIHHAGSYISAASSADAAKLSNRKLALLQLLHPSHLGQKFQVLHGWRSAPST